MCALPPTSLVTNQPNPLAWYDHYPGQQPAPPPAHPPMAPYLDQHVIGREVCAPPIQHAWRVRVSGRREGVGKESGRGRGQQEGKA